MMLTGLPWLALAMKLLKLNIGSSFVLHFSITLKILRLCFSHSRCPMCGDCSGQIQNTDRGEYSCNLTAKIEPSM